MNLITLKGKKNRTRRLLVKRCLKAGIGTLRIVGNENVGFRLAAQNDETIYAFGFVYEKQIQPLKRA
jgi:hypothetical protein